MKALEIRDLEKSYSNGVVALRKISIDVQQGDFFALLGPNGAGKTTTIGIITSLVNKSAGIVSVFGHDIDREFKEAKKLIGVMPQEFNCNIFETCNEILVQQAGFYGVPRAIALVRAEALLKKLSLWDKRNTISKDLSGGGKRRLMLARALIHEPRLLILDEPTAGVDIEIRRNIWELVRELNNSGTTIILTTHYLEEAESLCRNIAIMNQGQIIKNSTMKELLSTLETHTFILDCDQTFATAPTLNNFPCRIIEGNQLEIDVSKKQNLNDAFTQLNAHGITIHSMRNKANRLEELFLNLINQPKLG